MNAITPPDGNQLPDDSEGEADHAHKYGRPETVTDLIHQLAITPNFYNSNKRQNRFYLVNLDAVFTALTVDHTVMKPYFDKATETIKTTKWREQQPFKYESSHTQIYPKKKWKPKDFGHATTIVVALAELAAAKRPDYDVYEVLVLMAAQSFVDRFSKARLDELKAHYTALSVEEKEKIAGGGNAALPFESVILAAIEQPPESNVHEQLANGYTATVYTCEKLMTFVNGNFPNGLHVGPVRSCGDEDTHNPELGTKAAAPGLKVPRRLDRIR